MKRFVVAAPMLLIAGIGFAQTATVVVTPSNLHGWAPANVRLDASVAITDTMPRNGRGSLQFNFANGSPGQDKADFQLVWQPADHPERTLGSLDTLSFEYFRDPSSTTPGHFAPVLRLYFYDDAGTPSDQSDDTVGLLIWEQVYQPGFGGTVQTGQWVPNDLLADGRFWMYVIAGPGGSGVVQNYGLTLADWEADTDPATGQPPVGQAGDPTPPALGPSTAIVGINTGVGSGWGGTFIGFVDTVTMGFNGSTIRYNFEPDPAAAPGIPAQTAVGRLFLVLALLLSGGLLVLRRV